MSVQYQRGDRIRDKITGEVWEVRAIPAGPYVYKPRRRWRRWLRAARKHIRL